MWHPSLACRLVTNRAYPNRNETGINIQTSPSPYTLIDSAIDNTEKGCEHWTLNRRVAQTAAAEAEDD